jgi:glucuronosyltransferase
MILNFYHTVDCKDSYFCPKIVGNPLDVSAVPNSKTNFNGAMSFSQRIRNFLVYGVEIGMTGLFDLYQNIVYKRNFPSDNFMCYNEARRNMSLILVNNHFSQDHIRPLIPGLIEVGGLQIKAKPSPLPVVSLLCVLFEFLRISRKFSLIIFTIN